MKMLRLKQVLEQVPLSKSTIYQWVKEGRFPAPVKLTNRCTVWSAEDNHSLVVLVSYLGVKLLIPGDNEPTSWKKLLEQNDFRKAISGTNIFLAPHHGRESGCCTELFQAFSPKPDLVVVSDGRFCDTSATDRYSKLATGWGVYNKKGERKDRYCLTTRSDGVISVEVGKNPDSKVFMEVKTSK